MKRMLLVSLVLSGLSILSANVIREYHYVKMLKTWAEARSYCREKFIDLATVDSEDNNKRLMSVLQSGGQYAWIGLYDDLTRWNWTLGDAKFNNATDFSNWESSQPVTIAPVGRKVSCGFMNQDGFWYTSNCGTRHHSVCYNEQGPTKYILVTNKKKWHNAKTHCQNTYTGLVSVRNLSENNHISALLSQPTWIGLHRLTWANWSDQTIKQWTNWNTGQPDTSMDPEPQCAVVNTATAKWFDFDCKTKHHFICQRVHHKMTFKLKFESEADLNDPDAQQQILEQLHAKLKNHGLPDFKLRWIQKDGQTFHKQQKKEEEEEEEEEDLCS